MASAASPAASGPPLRLAAAAGGVAAVAMAAVIGWCLIGAGAGLAEAKQLAANPWGVVSLVDLYTGFALTGLWVWCRERNPLVAVFWCVNLVWLGNLATGLYVLKAALASDTLLDFFLGWRARHA